MKYKIEKRVPSSLSYGFDHLTLEGEVTKEDQADYQSAIRVSNAWEDEKRKALEGAGKLLCFDPSAPDPRHPPKQSYGKSYGAQATAPAGAPAGGGFGAVQGGSAAPAAPQAASDFGTIFPANEYEALMKRIEAATGVNRAAFEQPWLAAASANVSKKDGKTYFGQGRSLHDYARVQQEKGRPTWTISNAWKKIEDFGKILFADGHLTLRYPTYRNGLSGEDMVTLAVKNQNPGGMMQPAETAPPPTDGQDEWGGMSQYDNSVPF